MKKLIAGVQVALQQALAAAGLAAYDGPLIIGISAGPDSLVLLDVLARLLPGERLIVAHLDHGLRPTSAGDVDLAAQAARARGLRFSSARADVAGLARNGGQSLEAAGRAARYDFLAGVARATGAAAVVVGHNAGDQAETILLHLLRGTGISGLRGMSPATPLPGNPSLWLLRPLLDVTRADIEQYCVEAGLRPFFDESNNDLSIVRNRIRHELLPLLATFNPQIARQLRELGAIVTAEDDLLAALEDAAWAKIAVPAAPGRVALRRDGWRAQPLALRRRLLRRAAAHGRPALRDLSFLTIEAARQIAESGRTGARATLPGGLSLVVGYEMLEIGLDDVDPVGDWPQLPSEEPLSLPVPGAVRLAGGWRLVAESMAARPMADIEANPDPWVAFVALEDEVLVVRPRLPGERIRSLGLGGATKVKEVMIDRKIPAAARARWPIVATTNHPLWLVGHMLDERARVRPESRRVVGLRCFRDEGL